MFFIDKYAPSSISDTFFHKEEIERIKKMSQDNAVPHIIFYGPEGSGKKTLIDLFLELLYDKHVHDTVNTIYNVTGSGNCVTPISIKQSNYHIVIEPNNNNFDRYLIQDVVKEYAKRVPLGVFTSRKLFKTVLINNVDNLSYYAQTSLRRTMELYSSTCRFIMWTKSLSKVINPLRSRCYCFRIRAPKNSELLEFLFRISGKEQLRLSVGQYTDILNKANGNIKKALWLLQLSKFDESLETSYDETIQIITKLVLSCDLKKISIIRDLLYNIMITNISGTEIIKDVTDAILKDKTVAFICKIDISEIAADAEYNLVRGRREIIHLEKFIIGVMNRINTYLEN